MSEKSNLGILTNGILKENPVLVLALGTCPALAVSTAAINGISMGAAVIFVLVFSNFIISLLKRLIPDTVRIPSYIIVIAGLVTIVQMVVQAYLPAVDESLGIYLPLIVVNCIILGRAEAFASKNTVVHSVMDGLGMGIGFTLALFLIASIREIFGAGTWLGLNILGGINSLFRASIEPVELLTQPAGGFFVYGVVMAAAGYIMNRWGKKQADVCEACPASETCKGGE